LLSDGWQRGRLGPPKDFENIVAGLVRDQFGELLQPVQMTRLAQAFNTQAEELVSTRLADKSG
jgi:hypothetical protein